MTRVLEAFKKHAEKALAPDEEDAEFDPLWSKADQARVMEAINRCSSLADAYQILMGVLDEECANEVLHEALVELDGENSSGTTQPQP